MSDWTARCEDFARRLLVELRRAQSHEVRLGSQCDRKGKDTKRPHPAVGEPCPKCLIADQRASTASSHTDIWLISHMSGTIRP